MWKIICDVRENYQLGACRTDQIASPPPNQDSEHQSILQSIALAEQEMLSTHQCIMMRKKEHPPLVFDLEFGFKKEKQSIVKVIRSEDDSDDFSIHPFLYPVMMLSTFVLTLFVNWLMERMKMHQAQTGISVKFERQENIEML